jgi:hypothetical protein
MADIRELRDSVRKHEAVLLHIKNSIVEIKKQEAVVFNQALSGVLDNVSDEALKQKMLQFDAYREDRYSLMEQVDQIEAERLAMIEEIVNLLRRKIGMGDMQTGVDRPDLAPDVDDDITPSPHPGTVPPAVISNRKNRG